LIFFSFSSEDSDTEFSLKGLQETDIRYLRGNRNLPYIPYEDKFSNKKLTEFLLDPPTFAVCKNERPTVCQVNAIFTIDSKSLKDENDIKSDDFAWRNNGTKAYEVLINNTFYNLSKTYFVHKKYKDFKRRIYSLCDKDGNTGRYIMMCYWFQNNEHSVSPNKNARTQKSTLKSIVQKLKEGSSARDVYRETRNDAGGILKAATLSALPKTVKQIQKLKERSNEGKSSMTSRHAKKDELFAVISKCVEESHSEKGRFVQFVQGAPQPLDFLSDNRQLNDIERFCTNRQNPGILSIDTTYNCGEFYVTPTTYRHQMLLSKRTGKHPVTLGATMIHKHKDAEAFSYIGSCLTRKKTSLKNILAIGYDRDKAIKNGSSPSFPGAVFLACKKHFEDDIKRKLTELAINGAQRKEILVDIMGSDVTRERGLIDRKSDFEFDQALDALQETWNAREREARETNSPKFFAWFKRYQASDVKQMLLYPVRRDVGLGYDFYYNNDAECIHRNLKIRQDFKATDMPTVIDNIRNEKEVNLVYIEDAIIGNGPYELAPAFKHFFVERHTWTYEWSEARKIEYLYINIDTP
jgi:hypothetical protein